VFGAPDASGEQAHSQGLFQTSQQAVGLGIGHFHGQGRLADGTRLADPLQKPQGPSPHEALALRVEQGHLHLDAHARYLSTERTGEKERRDDDDLNEVRVPSETQRNPRPEPGLGAASKPAGGHRPPETAHQSRPIRVTEPMVRR